MAVKNLLIKVGVDGTRSAIGALKGVAGAIGNVAKSAVRALTSIQAFAGVAGLGLAVRQAGKFQQGLLELNTLIDRDLNRKSLKQLSVNLQFVARETGQSLGALTRANYDIISAGFADVADSAILLANASKLATAGNTDVSISADILTSALNSFGATAEQAGEISDLLFTTVRLGKTTIDELGVSLGSVLPFAKQAGADLDIVGASLATLTAKGIDTARASTSLRSAFLSLSAPTEGQRKAFEKYNVEIVKTENGNLDLLATLESLNNVPEDAIRKVIPSIEALTAINTLKGDLGLLRDNLEQMGEKAGATQDAFDIMASGFNFELSRMAQNFNSAMIAIGNALIEVLAPRVEQINQILSHIGNIGYDNIAKVILNNFGEIFNRLNQMAVTLTKALNFKFKEIAFLIKAELADIVPFTGNLSEELRTKAQQMGEEASNQALFALSQARLGFEFIKSEIQNLNIEISDGLVKSMNGVNETVDNTTDVLENNGEKIKDLRSNYQKLTEGVLDFSNVSAESFQKTAQASALQANSAQQASEKVVRSLFMEALARLVSNIFQTIPFPFNVPVAGGASAILTGLFDSGIKELSKIKLARFGMDDVVSQPTMIMAGEGNQRERVTVTPLDGANMRGGNQGGGIVLNISAPLLDDTVVDRIIPAINKATKLGIS
jgi:TP901 family phage tail tape measure protein